MRSAPLLLLVSACAGAPVSLGFDTDPAFTIEVDPPTLEVETGPDGTDAVPFTATARFEDGTSAVLDVVEWTLSNRSVGTLDEHGVFDASERNGGVTWVTAELDGVQGRAEVRVRFHDEQVVGDVDRSWFDDATPAPTEGHWLYPEDGVNVPRNTPSLRFQWAGVEGAAYKVAFVSASTDLVWYTSEPELLLDGATWSRIAATNAGGEVEITLSIATDGQVLEEPVRHVSVDRLDATGSIVYWCTDAWTSPEGDTVGGLMRIPFGDDAVPFFTPPQSGGHCVGCHSGAADGTIAFTYDGGNGPLGVLDRDGAVVVGYPAVGAVDVPRSNFSTFSPDGRWVLGVYQGDLDLWDATTGAHVQKVYSGDDVTHPAWSPDGSQVVLTLTTGHVLDWQLPSTTTSDARLALMPVTYDATTGVPSFGDWRVIVDPQSVVKAYYPSWSPDGRWIAYNQSSGDMYDDEDAEVWVVDGAGARPPVRLTLANGEGELTNSWPRWAPLPDDDVLWLAFGSTRAYGGRVVGRPQVWVTAFDPKRARAGDDPSWAAFWLPGQGETQSNHIPLWVK